MSQQKYILLDRDGVINHDSDAFIKSPDEWLPIKGSLEAIALLNAHGYQVVVVTNQSGVARGLFDEDTLKAIHAKMCRLVNDAGGKISAIYFCPHGADSLCECRKPKAGLLKQFALDFGVDLSGVPVVGDSLRDLQAANAVNALPVLVKTGKGERTLLSHPDFNFLVFDNLYDTARYFIGYTP
ncbi:D-glycero-D-manno-heptose 1,7-bisphosphate phosphatase [Patescibacteria group bacterium]|nr:D-glycero-D-manno-heptose 1,7-bisphosphate phosphatase [Patescibacteria group bacterium]